MQSAIEFHLIHGVRCTGHRAVGFLKGHTELNASAMFEELSSGESRYLLSSVDQWVSGANRPETRFHGWTSDREYSMCFQFRVRNQRFYGYLCHPTPKWNKRFQLCVLCIHAFKNERETDKAELARVKNWYQSREAADAVRVAFPDKVQ